MKDSMLCALFRALMFLMRFLPVEAWLFLARMLGGFYYYIASKQNQKALHNLNIAFKDEISLKEKKRIIKQMYRRMFENFFETLYLPYVDEAYVNKYIRIKGWDSVENALQEKRGIIFLGAHAGSWELSNVACALLLKDSSYAMLAQPQSKHKKIDEFLNKLRESKGVHVISVAELKKLITHLAGNNILGTIADHGGRDGLAVDFFSKLAMTPTGSIKLAKKLGSKIIVAFMRRLRGPYHEMSFFSCALKDSGGAVLELKDSLLSVNKMLESCIHCFPHEYLWTYKRWKYSPQTDVLILSDTKIGHLKQSLALARLMEEEGRKVTITVVDLKYKNRFFARLLTFIVFCFTPRAGRFFLLLVFSKKTVSLLLERAYDVVISAGSATVPVNLIVSDINRAKSLVVMKPGIFPLSKFNLIVAPVHDRLPQKSNVLSIAGAVNTIDESSMKKDFENFCSSRKELLSLDSPGFLKVGLLMGGDSKHYRISSEMVDFLCFQIKIFLKDHRASLLLTTSRRTSENIVKALESHFKGESFCPLFVDAARDNPHGTIGGIFYLSDIVIVSGESISMVSEAASSGKYVVVFEPRCKSAENRVERFLHYMAQKGYIFLIKPKDIYATLDWIVRTHPERGRFDARDAIKKKLKEILS